MRGTLDQLEAFFWIARLGSFRAAAAQLRLSQPTISLRIRSLEAALGLRLFERRGRRVRVTPEGDRLLPAVRRMMGLAEQVWSAPGIQDPLRGRLRLGAPASVALSCVADLLGALKGEDLELTVALTVDNSVALCQRLNRRELDVAFVVEPVVEPHVRLELLGAMWHAWVASPRLGLHDSRVEPRDLQPYHVFTHPEPSNLTDLVRGWFASAGLEPEHVSTCNDLSVIIRLTAAGEGVSLLPPAILATDLRLGSVHMLEAHPGIPHPHLYIAYQADKAGLHMKTLLALGRRVVRRSSLLASA
jgi:DNA-binding transcriptional LysR family regulator